MAVGEVVGFVNVVVASTGNGRQGLRAGGQ